MAVLEVTGARKAFESVQALDDASLRLDPGEWIALLGPNGAGKTTLIRSIVGLVRLDDGIVRLFGADRSLGDPTDRRLGFIPQDLAIYPALTARENLAAFAALHGVASGDIAGRVEWALEWTGLGDRGREPVKRFSGGMKRRLNIACGVLHQPEALLLDEPTVGVDPQSRQRIWEMLGELRRQGTALLLTTHQLDEAQQIAERIVIIDHGKVIANGTFDTLVTETIGPGREVTFHLAAAVPGTLGEAFHRRDERTVTCAVTDLAERLPGLLRELDASGAEVRDLSVAAPSLQSVFIHLTGRELRE